MVHAMPLTYKSRKTGKTITKQKNKLNSNEFDSFLKLAEAARDNDLDENAIMKLYHEMSRSNTEKMTLEQAEDYVRTLQSIHESADGAMKVYFQEDSEKRSPLVHYKMNSDTVLASTTGYYRFKPIFNSVLQRNIQDRTVNSRLNISVDTAKLPLLSNVISELTLKHSSIAQSKIISPGGIGRTTESAVIYLNCADATRAENIAKIIQGEVGADSFLPTTMVGVKEISTGIGYKEFSEGDSSSIAESLAATIRRAIDSQPNGKLNSEKKLRRALKDTLESRGYERKNPALRSTEKRS